MEKWFKEVFLEPNFLTMIIKPYLTFYGNAEEAMNFYIAVFGAEMVALSRYEGSPMDIPEEYGNKILHAEIRVAEQSILLCDAMPGSEVTNGSRISLNIDYPQIMEMESLFKRLGEGGTIQMPLQDTFWGARFGMLTDKFGISWMLNCDLN